MARPVRHVLIAALAVIAAACASARQSKQSEDIASVPFPDPALLLTDTARIASMFRQLDSALADPAAHARMQRLRADTAMQSRMQQLMADTAVWSRLERLQADTTYWSKADSIMRDPTVQARITALSAQMDSLLARIQSRAGARRRP